MKVVVEAVFENRGQAEESLFHVAQTVPELNVLDAKLADHASCPVSLGLVDSGRHDRLLFRIGVTGIIIGCLVGFSLISKVPSREMMYLFILPLSGAFWGLGLSLTAAMLLSDNLEKFWSGDTELFGDSIPREGVSVSVEVESGTVDRIRHSFAQHSARLISITPLQDVLSDTSFGICRPEVTVVATKQNVTSILSKTA